MTTYDLEKSFLGLSGDGEVTCMSVGPDFWQTIESNPNMRATMVSFGKGEGDWRHWEMHPKGDEVLIVVEGTGTLILDRDGREERHGLGPGSTFIVPTGIWRRAVDQCGLKIIFMTYGEGTQHRPIA